jgi:hypothetical protein
MPHLHTDQREMQDQYRYMALEEDHSGASFHTFHQSGFDLTSQRHHSPRFLNPDIRAFLGIVSGLVMVAAMEKV